MDRKHKIISVAITGMLILSIVSCIVVMVQIQTKGYVSIFGKSAFRVITGSMEPTIPVGALLISSDTDISQVEEGDIICYTSQSKEMLGQVITHRVVQVLTDGRGRIALETRGDANTVSDGYLVTEDNYIGKVVHYTGEGNAISVIFTVLTSRTGFLSCIVFPVLLIASFILKDSMKSIRKELEALQTGVAQTGQPEGKEDAGAETESRGNGDDCRQSLQELVTDEEYEQLLREIKEEIMEEWIHSVEHNTRDEGQTE